MFKGKPLIPQMFAQNYLNIPLCVAKRSLVSIWLRKFSATCTCPWDIILSMFGYRLSCLWRNISSSLTPKFGLTKRFLEMIFFFSCCTFLNSKDVFARSVFLHNIILISCPVWLPFSFWPFSKQEIAHGCNTKIHKASQGLSWPVCSDKGFEGTQVSSHSPYVMNPMTWVNKGNTGTCGQTMFLRTKELLLQSGSSEEQRGFNWGGGAASHPFSWLESKQSACPADSVS